MSRLLPENTIIPFCVLTALMTLHLSGCSSDGGVIVPTDPALVHGVDPSDRFDPESPENREPFSIEVLSEVSDGQRLAVMAQVTSHTNWNAQDVAVRLTTLHSGAPQEERVIQLSSVLPRSEGEVPMIVAGQQVPFLMTVSNSPLINGEGRATDYQLELLWGSEARAVLPAQKPRLVNSDSSDSTTPEVKASGLEPVVKVLEPGLYLKGSRCEGATNQPCQATFAIQAELFNASTDRLIQSIDLDLGIEQLSSKLEMPAPLPQNTERVNLTNVGLKPGQRRSISLTIEREVARIFLNQSTSQTFRPVMAVIDAR